MAKGRVEIRTHPKLRCLVANGKPLKVTLSSGLGKLYMSWAVERRN